MSTSQVKLKVIFGGLKIIFYFCCCLQFNFYFYLFYLFLFLVIVIVVVVFVTKIVVVVAVIKICFKCCRLLKSSRAALNKSLTRKTMQVTGKSENYHLYCHISGRRHLSVSDLCHLLLTSIKQQTD